MINKPPYNKGFTLLETLIAILILTLAIAGPLAIAGKDIDTTLSSKDELTAYYLAQDAVEYVRFIRDTNTLSGQSWLAGLNGTSNPHTNSGTTAGACVSSSGAAACTIDSLHDEAVSCPPSGGCLPINYDSSTNGGYFTYTTGSPSIFTRSVSIISPVGSDSSEAMVTVTVTWLNAAKVKQTVQVEEDLFNWQQ